MAALKVLSVHPAPPPGSASVPFALSVSGDVVDTIQWAAVAQDATFVTCGVNVTFQLSSGSDAEVKVLAQNLVLATGWPPQDVTRSWNASSGVAMLLASGLNISQAAQLNSTVLSDTFSGIVSSRGARLDSTALGSVTISASVLATYPSQAVADAAVAAAATTAAAPGAGWVSLAPAPPSLPAAASPSVWWTVLWVGVGLAGAVAAALVVLELVLWRRRVARARAQRAKTKGRALPKLKL